MKLADLNLTAMRRPLREALDVYTDHYSGLTFGEFKDLAFTPEKPNTARTIIPVTYKGSTPLDMYAIVFLPGDGTGDTLTYNHGELEVPPELQYVEKPEKVYPRSKKGVVCEGFFPLFSLYGRMHMFLACLEELTLPTGNVISHGWHLGMNPQDFKASLQLNSEPFPKISYTTGNARRGISGITGRSNERFGDPHAIHYPRDAPDSAQVAGFLAIKDEGHPIMQITSDWAMPHGYS